VDREEILRAGDRNLASVLRLIARTAPAGSLEDDGRLLLISTSRTWPGPYTNGALRLDAELSPLEVLSRAQRFFADRCPGYCVWIAAHADTDLEQAALEAGLAQIDATGVPRMVLDHRPEMPAVPAGVTLQEVVDEDGRREFLAVTIEAYRDSFLPAEVAEAQLATVEGVHGPAVRTVLARSQGRPVAGAMVVVSDGVAGVQLVGTIPDARGRGLAELCTAWTVDAGFGLGAHAAVLEASEMGEPVYRRMGFVVQSRYRWCFGPPPEGAGLPG
jgi:hypothetical protein